MLEQTEEIINDWGSNRRDVVMQKAAGLGLL